MTEPTSPERQSLPEQLIGLDNRFWIVNVMEMLERFAYYGVRAVVAIYIVLPASQGGPEFSHIDKGFIFAWWAGVQSILPMFTGGFADRYGHKRTIAFAIVLKCIGYTMMAYMMDFSGFFWGCMFLAGGTAIFKPGVQGTLAATLKESSASVGWGIFYQLVNIGGFLGPVIAGYLRLMDWSYVFLACAGIVVINFFWLPFYKDPSQEADFEATGAKGAENWASLSQAVPKLDATIWTVLLLAAAVLLPIKNFIGWWGTPEGAEAMQWIAVTEVAWRNMRVETVAAVMCAIAFLIYLPLKESRFDKGGTDALTVFVVSVVGLFQRRVLAFCLVFSGFWLMFNQVFDLLPNVIDDWVDSSGMIDTAGQAFSTPIVPGFLSLFLGVLLGLVAGIAVLLAMRPDHRPAEEVPPQSYVIVGLAFLAASVSGLSLFTDGWIPLAGAAGVGVIAAGLAMQLRLEAKLLAGLATAIGVGGAIPAIYGTLTGASDGLIKMAAEGAQVPPEWMINLNPGLIVFTMIGFAYLSSFVRPLTSIIIGMAVATAGSFIAGNATIGTVCLVGIAVFSIGEMLSSPKKMEYLATLAKKGQEGLFMGYANIPVAIGWIAGSYLAGDAYEKGGDKANLARKYLLEEVNMDAAAVEAIDRADVVTELAGQLGKTALETQKLLYETYSPQSIWYSIAMIGLASIVLMIAYDRILARFGREDD